MLRARDVFRSRFFVDAGGELEVEVHEQSARSAWFV
jgi:hypothetical protein